MSSTMPGAADQLTKLSPPSATTPISLASAYWILHADPEPSSTSRPNDFCAALSSPNTQPPAKPPSPLASSMASTSIPLPPRSPAPPCSVPSLPSLRTAKPPSASMKATPSSSTQTTKLPSSALPTGKSELPPPRAARSCSPAPSLNSPASPTTYAASSLPLRRTKPYPPIS